MSRPPKEFDQKEFEGLCKIQCNRPEICAFFETTPRALERWCERTYGKSFDEVYEEKASFGRMTVRRKLFQMAAEGHFGSIVWFTKNYMGFSDRNEIIPGVPSIHKMAPEQKSALAKEVKEILVAAGADDIPENVIKLPRTVEPQK